MPRYCTSRAYQPNAVRGGLSIASPSPPRAQPNGAVADAGATTTTRTTYPPTSSTETTTPPSPTATGPDVATAHEP